MSCILHISGSEFDVDSYLAKAKWQGHELKVYYIGDPRSKTGRFPPHTTNGFSLVASNAPFQRFEQQHNEVITFLKEHADKLMLLDEYKIDGWRHLNFGLSSIPLNGLSRTYIISPELARLTGSFDISIEMTNYFTRDKNYLKRKAKKRWPIQKG